MPRSRHGNDNRTLMRLFCVGIILASFVMAIIALVRIDTYVNQSAPAPAPAPPPLMGGQAAPVRLPVVRLGKNLVKLEDDSYCVESAGMPPGMKPKFSKATRAEGRIHALRVADPTKPKPKPNPQDELPTTGSCSVHISEGTIWRSPYKVIIDPTNNQGISRQLFVDMAWRSVMEWETRLTQTVVEGQDTDGCVDGFDDDSPDGKNEWMMGFDEEPGVLAKAIIWGIFSGPINQREILEVDVIFNLHFPWGNATVDGNVFDIQNVGTHEHGHCMGEGHTETAGATMFATASSGETSKRSLLDCEAYGLCEAYGEPLSPSCLGKSGSTVTPFIDVGPQSRCGVPPNGPPSPPPSPPPPSPSPPPPSTTTTQPPPVPTSAPKMQTSILVLGMALVVWAMN